MGVLRRRQGGRGTDTKRSPPSELSLPLSDPVADYWETGEEETKSDFFFFSRTVLLYKGMFLVSLLRSRFTVLSPSSQHVLAIQQCFAFYEPKSSARGLHFSSLLIDTGIQQKRDGVSG